MAGSRQGESWWDEGKNNLGVDGVHVWRWGYCYTVVSPFAVSAEHEREYIGQSAAVTSMNARHARWLRQVTSAGGRQVSWRPQKIHRLAATRFLYSLDLNLFVSTVHGGLCWIVPDFKSVAWSPSRWKSWPQLSVCMDQGGEQLAGHFALRYKPSLLANTMEWYDFWHGVMNDVQDCYRNLGLHSLMLLLLVTMNVAHGSDKDEDNRYWQLLDALRFLFETFTPESSLLFQARATEIMSELACHVSVDDSEHHVSAVWCHLREALANRRKGHRTRLCEFGAWVSKADALTRTWATTSFEYEFLCIEADYMQGKKFLEKVRVSQTILDADAGAGPTGTHTAALDVKILRGCSRNAVAIAYATLSAQGHRRLVNIMVSGVEAWQRWMSAGMRACRSTHEASSWLVEQLVKGLHATHLETLAQMMSREVLERCGFLSPLAAHGDELDAMLQDDDYYASMLGKLCLLMLSSRKRRLAWLTCQWPHRTFLILGGRALAEKTIEEFRQALTVYTSFSTMADPPRSLVDMLARSPFVLTSVKQWKAGFEQHDFKLHDDHIALALERSRSPLTTVAAEEMFGVAKNAKTVRGSKRFKRPERSMALCIGRQVLDKRHRYRVVSHNVSVSRRCLVLDKMSFGKGKRRCPSVSLAGVASTTAKAPWFSPKAIDTGRPAADAAALLDMYSFHTVGNIDKLYLGFFSCPTRQFIFRRRSTTSSSFDWHIGLHHYASSSFMASAVRLDAVPVYPSSLVATVVPDYDENVFFSVTDWSEIECLRYAWRGWASLQRLFPLATKHWGPAVRMLVVDKEPQPLAVVAASAAFWNADVSLLHRLAEELKICSVTKDHSLVDTLLLMVTTLLGCTEAEAMKVIAQRLSTDEQEVALSSELLQVDEAVECLDRNDTEVLKTSQTTAKEYAIDKQCFKTEFIAKSRMIYARDNPPPKKVNKPKKADDAVRKLPTCMSGWSHAEAKALMPVGGHVWRTHGDMSWNARMPPFGARSASWRKWGESDALRRVISHAWRQWAELNGLTIEQCPIKDLIVEDGTDD